MNVPTLLKNNWKYLIFSCASGSLFQTIIISFKRYGLLLLKFFELLHLKDLLPSWTVFLCFCKSQFRTYDLVHKLHLKSLIPS